jgi:hypothetical protein
MAKTAPYLSGSILGMGNAAGSSQAGFASPIGKTRTVQNLGNVTGRRGAGMARFGGSQLNHAFNHYGKSPDWTPDSTNDGSEGGGLY